MISNIFDDICGNDGNHTENKLYSINKPVIWHTYNGIYVIWLLSILNGWKSTRSKGLTQHTEHFNRNI